MKPPIEVLHAVTSLTNFFVYLETTPQPEKGIVVNLRPIFMIYQFRVEGLSDVHD